MVKSSAAGYAASPSRETFPSSQLVADDDEARPHDPLLSSAISLAAGEAVFPLLQRVRAEIEAVVDTPLTWDQLRSPTLNFSVVRPLVLKLTRGDRPAISLIYCLLIARAHFLDRADEDLAFAVVNTSRADLCELLAIKGLSAYGVAPNSYELLHVLTTSFNPFAGVTLDMFDSDEDVDEEALQEMEDFGRHQSSNALELAVLSKAKRFVKNALVQQVISAIDSGAVIYTPESSHALIQDNYKSRPVVQIYDWRQRPFLDHHLLRIPRIRGRVELCTFATMLALFLIVQSTYSIHHINLWEALFIAWGLGFALDEWSSIQQHGLTTYFGGAFNVLDSIWCLVYFAYLALRIAGLRSGDESINMLAFDTLGLGGCVLLPRLTISLLRGNVVLLALSKMIREFSVFMGLAFLTASGFLCTFRILSRGNANWDLGHIAWLMLKIWLGSAFLGFDAAQQFHPFYGPFLMTLFAILAQTLLLTILISLLSSTFASVQANADTEIVYQMALRTIERAKADPLTCYAPPLNTLALVILLPFRYCSPPRVLHKVQVYLARILNLPILLFLALYTRATYQKRSPLYLAAQRTSRLLAKIPRTVLGGVVPILEGSVEQVAKEVFERPVTAEGRRVASIDDATPPTADAVDGGGDSSSDKGKRAATASVPKQKDRTDSLGSLTSPLARIFGHQASASLPHPTARSQTMPTTVDQNLETRLARIEEALQILVGEVVKSGPGGGAKDEEQEGGQAPKSSEPLLDLTGRPEAL
ncbi:hypothetical protein JCM10908_005553 [Rhodotorula pacifica]|uniref:uncharacterized protein n=1 Tax=Rhodotorula pacifica TaxID=1495444 RepID=UPI003178A05C